MVNSLTSTSAAPTPVQLSNQSAALPGTGNPITAGPMASPGTLNVLTGTTGGGNPLSGGGGAVPATMQTPPPAAPPPPAGQGYMAVPAGAGGTGIPAQAAPPLIPNATPPEEPMPEAPSYVSFLNSRTNNSKMDERDQSAGYNPVGWGATHVNPLFGTRAQRMIQDAEAATGEPVVINETFRPTSVQAQYKANRSGRAVPYETETGEDMVAHPKPGMRNIQVMVAAPGRSRHQHREDGEMGSGVEAMDVDLDQSGKAWSWMRANASRYGITALPGDKPHFQLNRNMALTDDEASDVIAKLGFPDVEAFQAATGADVDGVIGPQTRGKILAAMAKGVPAPTMVAGAEEAPAPLAYAGDTLTDADRAIEAVSEVAANTPPIGNIDPANWQDTRRAIWEGNVPWNDLPPEWRDELTAKFGKNAPARYDEARDRLASEERGFTVQGETRNLPEMWGESADEEPAAAAEGTVKEPTGEVVPKPAAVLARGAKGPEVAGYQMMLAGLGMYEAGIDQDYGRRTENAVKAFQAANGLKVDGKIGPKTGPAIEAAFGQKIANPRAPVVPIAPTAPTAREKALQLVKRGGPVDMTDADRAELRRTPERAAGIRAARGFSGNDLTRMSIDRSAEGGYPRGNALLEAGGGDIPPTENWGKPIPGSAPVVSSDLVRGGAGPGGVETATMDERREAAKEAVRAEVEEKAAERAAWVKEQGTVPATDRPPLTPRFERLPPEAKVQEIQDVIDANQGIPEDRAVFGTDPHFDNIKGGSAADRLRQRLEEAEADPTRPPAITPGSESAATAFGEDVEREEERAFDAADVAAGVGAGTLRGVEDVVGQVANALGWGVTSAASLLAREGIITKETAAQVAANEERRRAFTETGPATEAIAGEGSEDLPGYGVGRVIGQGLATAAPVVKTLQLMRAAAAALGPGAEAVGNFLTGMGGVGSKTTAGGIAGGESALLAGEDPGWGAAGGAVGGLGVALGGPAARWVADKVKGLPAPREAIQSVRTMINDVGLDIDDAIARLRADPDARLFDLDPAIADEARALAATGGNKATSVLKKAIETRDSGASEAMLTGLDRRLGRLDSPNDTIKRINDAIQTEFRPLDEAAKKSIATIDAKPVVSLIDETLAKSKSNPLKNVLSRDVRPALHDNNGYLEFEVAPLLKARQAIDGTLENAPKALSSGDLAELRAIRSQLDKALKAVPEVRHRDMVYASGKKVEEAFEAGKQFMKTGGDDVKTVMQTLTPGERMAYKAGARASIDDFVKSNPVVRGGAIVKNAENAAKFQRVFGDAGQEALDFMEREFAKKGTGHKIARGSETAASQGRSGVLSKAAKAIDTATAIGGGALAATHLGLSAFGGAAVGYGVKRGLGALASRLEEGAKGALAEALALKGDDAIRFLEAVRTIGAVRPGNKLLATSAAATGNSANERRRAVRERSGNPLMDAIPTGN